MVEWNTVYLDIHSTRSRATDVLLGSIGIRTSGFVDVVRLGKCPHFGIGHGPIAIHLGAGGTLHLPPGRCQFGMYLFGLDALVLALRHHLSPLFKLVRWHHANRRHIIPCRSVPVTTGSMIWPVPKSI